MQNGRQEPTRHRPVSRPAVYRRASRRTETADRNAQTCGVTNSLPVDDIRIWIDDRFRDHRHTANGIGIIGNSPRLPEREKRRRDVAFHR